jgi:hypothetical protein
VGPLWGLILDNRLTTSVVVALGRRAHTEARHHPLKEAPVHPGELRRGAGADDRAGWPGERIGADAAANRVRVALTTLRKLGLRDVIKTGQGGYLLDPAMAVTLEHAS